MVLGMLVGLILAADHPRKAVAQGAPPEVIKSLRLGLDATLKDYPSARFRDVHLKPLGDGGWMVCGFVNSRNSAGGYVGWTRFQALSATVPAAIVLVGDSPALAQALDDTCAMETGFGSADLSKAVAPG